VDRYVARGDQDTIRKIEAINPKLNAVIFKKPMTARQQASTAALPNRRK
jgi:hypothetical protein